MGTFTIHSIESAPEKSKPVLEKTKKSMGFVPNLFGALAESPAAVEAYPTISGIFEKTDLTPTERQVVLMTASYDNGCDYCVSAHTVISKGQNIDDAVIEALRTDEPLPDEKLEALRTFTRAVIRERGWVDQSDLKAFLDAGYTKGNVWDVILGVSFKTLSNYVNHLAETPLDDAFESARWERPAGVGA